MEPPWSPATSTASRGSNDTDLACSSAKFFGGIKTLASLQSGSSPAKRDFGLPMGEKLVMRQQCALVGQKASCVLGCITRNLASRSREVILLCSAFHLEYCIQVGDPVQDRHGPGPDRGGLEEAMNMEKRLTRVGVVWPGCEQSPG